MPVRGNILFCEVCQTPQPQVNYANCIQCGSDLGAPNVNEVSTEDEINALEKRYINATNFIIANGNEDGLEHFKTYFSHNVNAVINLSFKAIKAWLLTTDRKYKSYSRLLEEGDKQIKTPFNDKWRTMVDGYLYGDNGRDIVFAALSLDGAGLLTYGDCTVIINEPAIALRATVIEENSFNFAGRHKFDINKLKGYRSVWNDKLKLAVAKLEKRIENSSTKEDFVRFILFTDGDRHSEEFIEVHIYKALFPVAIKSIHIPATKSAKDIVRIKAIGEKYPGIVFI